ncbi:MAG: 50S ribosomal protein L3 [Myxococcales bacterium]|nr:50S ribosomal protein L3 [Myxococcota bacterium]MDW8283679.1 50S ribosomal protein L3 [Myxococcales bacterium]
MAALRTGLIGKKLGMTQIFGERGERTGVTVIHAGGCVVLGKRTPDKDGYAAIRLGYGEKPLRLCNKPELGRVAKLPDVRPPRLIREIRLDPKQLDEFEIGKPVPLSKIFKPGTFVDVTGVTKGKGYQGVMKRHHMGGSRNSHGTHEFFRHGGSIGCRLTPGRVHKGKRMSGHMGHVRCTVQNLALMQVLEEEGLLIVRGAVPGAKNGWVMVRNATKRTGPVRFGEAEETPKAKKAAVAKKAPAKKK